MWQKAYFCIIKGCLSENALAKCRGCHIFLMSVNTRPVIGIRTNETAGVAGKNGTCACYATAFLRHCRSWRKQKPAPFEDAGFELVFENVLLLLAYGTDI